MTRFLPPDSCVSPAKSFQNVPASIWVSINQSVAKYKPVNLGQGFPDFDPPHHVLQNLVDVTNDPNTLYHQYTRSMGHAKLVEVLAELYRGYFCCETKKEDIRPVDLESTFLPNNCIDPMSNVIISVGAYGSLSTAFSVLVNPGDECIVMEPNFDCYGPMVTRAGGKPVYVQLRPKDEFCKSSSDWVLDMNQLESVMSDKTRLLVLNTPHNPLGKVFSKSELQQLAEFCVRHNLLCISDEVYEWIVFGDNGDRHIKIASLPGMWGRTVTIGSAGKTFSATGWKLGWTIGPKSLIQAMQSYQQNTVYTCPTPIQEAVARSLQQELDLIKHMDADRLQKDCYLFSLRHKLKALSLRMASCLERANMKPVLPQSGYFMIADISQIPLPEDFSNMKESRDIITNEWLMQKKGICGIPQSVFYNLPDTKKQGENYIRWCFAKNESTLESAFSILENI